MTTSTLTTLTQQAFRTERDSMGDVPVAIDKYWGAQTKRSRTNFLIGSLASMPNEIILPSAYFKKAAAYTNKELNVRGAEMRIPLLNPLTGYNNRAKVAKAAPQGNKSLHEAVIKFGVLTSEEFDQWVKPENMIGNNS